MTIPPHKTKMRRAHTIPLSLQALAILATIEHDADYSHYLFPSLRSVDRPMSENTINAALRRIGFAQDEMTGHGFRAMAATLLNEMGLWHPDAIERQRAHCDNNAVRRAYTRGEYWDERVRRCSTGPITSTSCATGRRSSPVSSARQKRQAA